MNKNDTMKWEDIYKVWKWEMCKFPVLLYRKDRLRRSLELKRARTEAGTTSRRMLV